MLGEKPKEDYVLVLSLFSKMLFQFATENVLAFCLRGLIGEDAQKTVTLFCCLLSDLTRKEHRADSLDALDSDVTTLLALMERDLPISLQNITTHLLRHLAQDIRNFGPVAGRSMFTTERTICWLSRQNHNKQHPETTIIQTYIVSFLAIYHLGLFHF